MKIEKILESFELNNPTDHKELRARFEYWFIETLDSGFACKVERSGKIAHIVLVKARKKRSDAGKERVNRTGFRRGTNPLPRNLDKISTFDKKD